MEFADRLQMYLLSFPLPYPSPPPPSSTPSLSHPTPHTQGTDEATIISVLTKRSNGHRQEVRKKFQALYNKVCVCVNMCIHVNVCMYMYTHTVSVYVTKGLQIFDHFPSPSPGSDTGAQVRDFRQFQRVHCCLDGAQGTSMF